MDVRRGNQPLEPAAMSIGEKASGGQGRLGFIDLALSAFTFLLRLGFELIRREPTRLVFESPSVFVNVYHGRSSYQVGVEIGRLDDARHKYSLYEVLAVLAPSEVEKATCQTTDPIILDRCLSSIADVVERTCGPLFAGDVGAFEDLRLAVAPRRKEVTVRAQFGAILDRADQAWEAKDLRRAKEFYQKAETALDEPRRRRLEYLMKREGEKTR
jgi:hypothetical protein